MVNRVHFIQDEQPVCGTRNWTSGSETWGNVTCFACYGQDSTVTPPGPKRDSEWIALRNQGLTHEAIADRYNVTRGRVHARLHKLAGHNG